MKENERQLDVFRFCIRDKFNDLTNLISSPRSNYQAHFASCDMIFYASNAMISLALSLDIIELCEYDSLVSELHNIYKKALDVGWKLPDRQVGCKK